MPEAPYLVAAVLVSAGVTWGLRALPFTFLGRLRSSELLAHVGDGLPVGVMLILVLHTVRETELGDVRQAVPVVVGLAVTGGLHLWRGNALLSIFSGTAAHVVLASALW
ncbi:branched-chain amino acid transporter permease [Actinosynnema pretiosum]|uniref:Branched-chain amino acid ABC transporter n=1 Tax=Actinosynnema pretiosum TaxID=42197 RepID=A0A290Z4G8_9PSEU|nr:AzlD domain-containing protein [Actinosynnema pretiosum]ATE53951.1 branched-chain amino acid ABC transporter [Actinosynnema pretiosum]